MSIYSEARLIEGAALEILASLGWEVSTGPEVAKERGTLRDVVLSARLQRALTRLNPKAPTSAIEQVVDILREDRSAMGITLANREVYRLITEGVPVAYRDAKTGKEEKRRLYVIDWERPEENHFLAVSQFRAQGPLYHSVPDITLFINGLPFVIIELKARRVDIRQAYDENFTRYKHPQEGIPKLFAYNAFLVASNGREAKLGSLTADWDRFFDWKRVDNEEEERKVSMEVLLRGSLDKAKLLDIVRNFTLFSTHEGSTIKIVAQNHQYIGVNQAIERMREAREDKTGQGGVFWQTQGSGKSLSMVFYGEKIHRTISGNFTFVIVTDRVELDDQIAKTFASVGAVQDLHACHAGSGEHLRRLLSGNHRYVFTLIHKFQTNELLSDRRDIIVIADEAHRSQYAMLALNMRAALPNAIFVAFTGTPLIAGEEERTRAVFGEYVSRYDFEQSIEDGATVPLYYENRTPELSLTNPSLNEDIYQVIDDAGLDEATEARLQSLLGQRYHLITRDDRLDTVAEDIVNHFLGRGFQGKAMVVSIDKKTAYRTYRKVLAAWEKERERVTQRLSALGYGPHPEREILQARLAILNQVEMALVVSPSIADDDAIKEELEKMAKSQPPLDARFKDSDDPLSIVFVCAMWLTGFDAPKVSTIYLDKPMRGHTLMQTIARANRVHPGKVAGTVVDYVNVFESLEEALSIYGKAKGGEAPLREKGDLVLEVRKALAKIDDLCLDAGASLSAIEDAPSDAERLRRIEFAANALVKSEDRKKEFLIESRLAESLYASLLPHKSAVEFQERMETIAEVAVEMRGSGQAKDIGAVLDQIGKVLDRSIEGVLIAKEGPAAIDLSRIDFAALKKRFKGSKTKELDVERMKAAIRARLERMIRQNETRVDFLEKFEELIEAYNAGSMRIEKLFEELLDFMRDLDDEEKRHVRESLSEEELVVFDLLTRPGPSLSKKERDAVKAIARDLLDKLKAVLTTDWQKTAQARARVRELIADALDAGLPEAYSTEVFEAKAGAIFEHVYERYGSAA